MNELTNYLTNKLKNLSITADVSDGVGVLNVFISKPFSQKIFVCSGQSTNYWDVQISDDSLDNFELTDDMVEEILDKLTIYRSWGKNTDKGILLIIKDQEVIETPTFNGRFSIGRRDQCGNLHVFDQPFIDHWRYILIGLDKYGITE